MSTEEKKIIQIDEYHCSELERLQNEEQSIRALVSIVMENAKRDLRKLGMDRNDLWKEIYEAAQLDMEEVDIEIQPRRRIGTVTPRAEKTVSSESSGR